MKTTLSLLTINGCFINNQNTSIFLQKIEEDQFLRRKYRIKPVKNFVVLSLEELSICVSLYSKGGFKFTISSSKYFKVVIDHLELVTHRLIDLLSSCYKTSCTEVQVKLTQIALLFKNRQNKLKFSYQDILKLKKAKNNTIVWQVGEYKFTHTINWVQFEVGTSNFFFEVSKDAKVGGLKLFNNFKTVLLVYNIDSLPELLQVSITLVNQIKNGMEWINLSRH